MKAYREFFTSENGHRGLTQEGLLRRMASMDDEYAERFSHATVSRWESGATRPTVHRLQVFGSALGLSPTEVAGLLLLAGLAPDFQTALGLAASGDSGQAIGSNREDDSSVAEAAGDQASTTVLSTLGDVARFVSIRVLLPGVAIVVGGYVLSLPGWNDTWAPVVYVGFATGLVLTQGFLLSDEDAGLREFFWVSLFFLLSTPLLQFAPIGMDHYNFYAVGDFAGTHVPYMLALLVNLVLASSAGLMLQLLWKWQYPGRRDGSTALQRAVWTALPPVGFVYAVVVVISNTSIWIQFAVLMPVVAAVFTSLLILRDPSVNPGPNDRQFLLWATVVVAIISTILAIATILGIYMLPDLPRVLPDHNLLRSWEIDFAGLGFSREEALDRLNLGYMWHAMFVFVYMVFVVGGNLIVTIYRIGEEDTVELEPALQAR